MQFNNGIHLRHSYLQLHQMHQIHQDLFGKLAARLMVNGPHSDIFDGVSYEARNKMFAGDFDARRGIQPRQQ